MNSRMQSKHVRGWLVDSIEQRLAAVFYADLLLPLKRAYLRRDVDCPDRRLKRPSYWSAVASRTGGLQRLAESDCNASALLGLLGSYWEQNREIFFPQLLPHLELLRRDLMEAQLSIRPSEPELTEFMYPLF
jgi:hypothetical protein